jgi:uncharacterized protein (TIGR02117 family)
MAGWRARLGVGALVATVLVGVALALSARPGDPALFPAPTDQPGVAVTIVSHGYHAGLVVPTEGLARIAADERLPSLSVVARAFASYVHVEIGWGDEGFYRGVPTISDLRALEALRALFRPGNASVVHVVGLVAPPRALFTQSSHVDLSLSTEGFRRLAHRLEASFTRLDGAPVHLGVGLYGPSAFYRAEGTFNLLNVCNHWLARLLDAAGVPTNPLLSTLPHGLFLDLAWRSGLRAG